MIWSILAFLTLLAGLFVIYPLLRKTPRVQSDEGQQANIVLFREDRKSTRLNSSQICR